MKVLILTCNTGEGHNSASAAIQEACAQRGVPCDTADTLGFLSQRTSEFICNWHTRIYRHLPKLFGSSYGYAENHPAIFADRRLAYRYLASGVRKLRAMLKEQGYDTVICVHVFSALMMTQLLRQQDMPVRTAFVATDYTCSPITGDTLLDLYFIPHQDLVGEFSANNIPREKLIPAGIPVRQVFYDRPSREEARKKLGLPIPSRQVLLMSGSMGCGPLEELTEQISAGMPPDAELTVICGTNTRLVSTLSKKERNRVRILSYTQQMSLWLAAADLFLTKPGGLSTTEAATSGTPILFLDTVGGCETRNRQFFASHGWADTADSVADMAERCVSLLRDNQQLEVRSAVLGQAFRRNAAQLIVDTLCAQSEDSRCSPDSQDDAGEAS